MTAGSSFPALSLLGFGFSGRRGVGLPDRLLDLLQRRLRAARIDTFAEFHYAYHYGDTYSPYLKQEEPLKTECQHVLDCIQNGKEPLTNGARGMDLVKILEASSQSLKLGGGQVSLHHAEPLRQPANSGAPAQGRNGKDKNGKFHIPVSTVAEPRIAL